MILWARCPPTSLVKEASSASSATSPCLGKESFFWTVMLHSTAVAAMTLPGCISLKSQVKPNKAKKWNIHQHIILQYGCNFILIQSQPYYILTALYLKHISSHLQRPCCVSKVIYHTIDIIQTHTLETIPAILNQFKLCVLYAISVYPKQLDLFQFFEVVSALIQEAQF